MTTQQIIEKVTPKVCYMGNVQTLDTFEGLLAAERYIRKNKLNISTSFSNKSFEKPKRETFDCGYIYEIDDTDIEAYQGGITMLEQQKCIYPFVNNPTAVENMYLSMYSKVLYKVSNNKKLRKYEEDFLFDKCDFIRYGVLKLKGWIYDFKPFLKTFWVEDECGHISEYKALNKKFLTTYLKRYDECKFVKIVEITR